MGRPRRQDTALKLWVVLARAHRAIEEHARIQVARHDLTLPEFGVLEALLHKGPLLLGELQRKILVSSGGITYVVDRLEGKGLVERQPCPDDRRARYVALTASGVRLIESVFAEHAETIELAMRGLGETEQRALADRLRTLGTYAAGRLGVPLDPV
ncbi:MAG: MarR family transcriptional regulator [Gemmatimonadales bacterium]|nr:MarR family transcriptional regulator [Gemmatimonadales bacterium]